VFPLTGPTVVVVCINGGGEDFSDTRVDSSKDINSIEQASVRYKWHVSDFDAINTIRYEMLF